MKAFWILFRKEFRFLAGPGIALFVVLYLFGFLGIIAVHYLFPGFYHDYILRQPEHPTMFYSFFIRPVMLGDATTYMYALLFLYSVLYEHIVKSRYQLFALPVHRTTHIALKFGAVTAWVIIYFALTIIASNAIFSFRNMRLAGMARASFDVVSLSIAETISHILLISGLFMLGYVTAIILKRVPYLVGMVSFLTSYLLTGLIVTFIGQFIHNTFPYDNSMPVLFQLSPWSTVICNGIVLSSVIVAALFLYNRFAEV